MSNLKKCPICELNYISMDKECCDICNPNKQKNLISTEVERCNDVSYERMKFFNDNKRSMKEFYSIRFNKVIR